MRHRHAAGSELQEIPSVGAAPGATAGARSERAGSDASAQSRSQQTAGVALKSQQGMIHVLIVGTVEEAELLMTMGGIVGGIHIQEDLTATSDLWTTNAHEPIEQSLLQQEDLASRGRVLPSAQGGL